MFFCIAAVIYVVGADAVYTYHVGLTSFLGAGLVFTTSSVNSLIYYPDAAKEAAAAGFILLSIDSVCVTVSFAQPFTYTDNRSYGCSTSALSPKPVIARHLTPSRCIRTMHRAATVEQCASRTVQKQRTPLVRHNSRCTTQRH